MNCRLSFMLTLLVIANQPQSCEALDLKKTLIRGALLSATLGVVSIWGARTIAKESYWLTVGLGSIALQNILHYSVPAIYSGIGSLFVGLAGEKIATWWTMHKKHETDKIISSA